MNSRKHVIVAARKRGWSTTMIAKAAGISHQAVSQMLQKAEKQSGPIITEPRNISFRPRTSRNPSHPWKCRNCGAVQWTTRAPKKTQAQIFCSSRCNNEYNTKVSPNDIAKAIQMRYSNQTWFGISKAIGLPVQTLQKAIWIHLFRTKMLTSDMAHRIWRPPPGLHRKHYSWNHASEATGIVPSVSGGKKVSPRRHNLMKRRTEVTTRFQKSDNPSSNINGLTKPV
jgi:hypothetical protein